MNAEQLLENVTELLGFRVSERENDAVLVRPTRGLRDSVRPATADEVRMFTAILGLVTRLNDAAKSVEELRAANKDLAEERAFLAEVHTERLKSMQAKHDAGLIAAAERMQAEWLKKFEEVETGAEQRIHDLESELRNAYSRLEHEREAKESAQEMANQMHSQLSDAEEKITELKAEVANLTEVIRIAETATCDVHGNEGQS